MTKQGTHIEFQLVTVCYQRDSKQNKKKQNTIINYIMLFLQTCLLVTLDRL